MVSNMDMALLPPRRLGIAFKVGALAIVLCAGGGIAWILGLRSPAHGITDQDVLREAVAEWHRAGEPGEGPNDQIFEQQAAQGYYDDARRRPRTCSSGQTTSSGPSWSWRRFALRTGIFWGRSAWSRNLLDRTSVIGHSRP